MGASESSFEDADLGTGVYSIGAVTRMLGIPAQTLRAWEERYVAEFPAHSDVSRWVVTRPGRGAA